MEIILWVIHFRYDYSTALLKAAGSDADHIALEREAIDQGKIWELSPSPVRDSVAQ